MLIEFQNLGWIVDQRLWYQISHDHVNQFSTRDFSERYEIVSQGEFSGGEWSWVLVDPSTFRSPTPRSLEIAGEVRKLWCMRESALEKIARLARPIAIWGAAGKGTVLSFALKEAGVSNLAAIDTDRNRWNRYLESSGIQVLSPAQARTQLPRDTLVLVCNPNHMAAIELEADVHWDLAHPKDFI